MSYRRDKRDKGRKRVSITDTIINNSDVILNKSNIEKFVDFSEQFGRLCYKNKVSTSQIRGIYHQVKRLQNNINASKSQLQLLRPKLAYQKGRFRELTDLQMLFDHLIKNVKTDDHLLNFKEFFEAVICYHKAAGGD